MSRQHRAIATAALIVKFRIWGACLAVDKKPVPFAHSGIVRIAGPRGRAQMPIISVTARGNVLQNQHPKSGRCDAVGGAARQSSGDPAIRAYGCVYWPEHRSWDRGFHRARIRCVSVQLACPHRVVQVIGSCIVGLGPSERCFLAGVADTMVRGAACPLPGRVCKACPRGGRCREPATARSGFELPAR